MLHKHKYVYSNSEVLRKREFCTCLLFVDDLILHSVELKMLFLHIFPFPSRKHTRINFCKLLLVLQTEIHTKSEFSKGC